MKLSILYQIIQQWWILHIQKWHEAWSSKTVSLFALSFLFYLQFYCVFFFFAFLLIVVACRLSVVCMWYFLYITRHHQPNNKTIITINYSLYIYLDDNFRFIIAYCLLFLSFFHCFFVSLSLSTNKTVEINTETQKKGMKPNVISGKRKNRQLDNNWLETVRQT